MPPRATRRPDVDQQTRLLMRGVEYGDEQIRAAMERELRESLAEGRPLRVYCGFDPTSTELTLGNAVPLRKLRQFQDLGHKVTFLIGDFTGLVGDPSDKDAARPMLTPEEAEANSRTWLRQAFRVLDPEKTIVRRNSEWLKNLTMADVVQLASRFTVAQFLERDIFVQRRQRGEPVYLHEFMYALLQAYDATAMETDVQVGATDQLFNIMAGRTLQKALGQRPQVAITLPILLGTDGKLKMSKSAGNHVSLDAPPDDMYGKVMSIPDHLIIDYFTLVTAVPGEEIEEMRRQLSERSLNPMELKKRLAREIVAEYHGPKEAERAQERFEGVFQRRAEAKLPFGGAKVSYELIRTVPVSLSGPPLGWISGSESRWRLARVLVDTGLASSISEARRLIRQGAVDVDGVVHDSEYLAPQDVRDGMTIRVGKHRFLRIVDADRQ